MSAVNCPMHFLGEPCFRDIGLILVSDSPGYVGLLEVGSVTKMTYKTYSSCPFDH